jgi:hypothetical protein
MVFCLQVRICNMDITNANDMGYLKYIMLSQVILSTQSFGSRLVTIFHSTVLSKQNNFHTLPLILSTGINLVMLRVSQLKFISD